MQAVRPRFHRTIRGPAQCLTALKLLLAFYNIVVYLVVRICTADPLVYASFTLLRSPTSFDAEGPLTRYRTRCTTQGMVALCPPWLYVHSVSFWLSLSFYAVVVAMMIAPHFSLFLVLVDHYLLATQKPASFLVHSFVIYSLTFLSFSSLIVCVVRDPGPVNLHESPVESSDDYALREALMSGPDDDEMSPQKWCRKCWAPKYERTHHCTQCNRCVLKMGA